MNSYPSPGDGLARALRYMQRELRSLADRIAALARRVAALEAQHPHVPAGGGAGEMPAWHFPGALTVAVSDPRPVVQGGRPRLHVQSRVPPSTAVTLQPYRNGVPAGAAFVVSSVPHVEDVQVTYLPGDTIGVGSADLGAGGTAGMVVVAEFR